MSKSIYTFNIKKKAKVEEKRVEKYIEDGVEKERTITESVEKEVPIEILLKEPNRKQVQEAELVFSIEMSKCIKQGILTKAMLLNKYKDTGGLASETDSKQLTERYQEYEKAQLDLVTLKLTPEAERAEDFKDQLSNKEAEVVNLRKDIIQRETSYLSLFNHTADTKAQNKSILWYVLNLSFYKDPTKNHKDFVPVFEGKTFEEKEENMAKMEDAGDFIYEQTYLKLASIFSYWFFSGTVNKEEFDKIINESNG